MPLFDKRLEVLHTSINSARSQINANPQKIADLENRNASYEVTTATMEQVLANHQERESVYFNTRWKIWKIDLAEIISVSSVSQNHSQGQTS